MKEELATWREKLFVFSRPSNTFKLPSNPHQTIHYLKVNAARTVASSPQFITLAFSTRIADLKYIEEIVSIKPSPAQVPLVLFYFADASNSTFNSYRIS